MIVMVVVGGGGGGGGGGGACTDCNNSWPWLNCVSGSGKTGS